MKVAIVGAGLAGLSCAYGLRRYGITADVFEKQSQIGSPFEHAGLTLRLFDSTPISPVKYLKRKYGLEITPLFPLTGITMYGPTQKTLITGKKLGSVILRSGKKNSLENQIAAHARIPITLNTDIEIKKIKNDYEHIVVATGNGSPAKDLGLWTTTFNAQIRVAMVIGKFETGAIQMWVNTNYSKNCYCYLLPINTKQATLSLTVNDAGNDELDFYWKEFLLDTGIDYKITETWDAEQNIGYPSSVQVENIYFAGYSAGLVDDFIGIGAVNSIESGLLAARAIAKNQNYAELIQPLIQEVRTLHEFRKVLNTFENADFDRLVAFLGLPGIKHFIYKNPLFRVWKGAFAARLYNRLKYQ